MRHARRTVRLSRSSAQRRALLNSLARHLLQHGRIRTTVAKAKETKRVVDRLISLGKEGSVHSRRRAYRLLQNRQLVKRLFGEVAPQFLDCPGGYTRLLRLSPRAGDGAPQALLELTRLPVTTPPTAPRAKAKGAVSPATAPARRAPEKGEEAGQKPKGFFEGLRERFRRKKSDAGP